MADVTLGLYAAIYCTIDGAILKQETSVSIDKQSGLNPVETVALGLAGASQGSTKIEVSIESAIPSTDLEFNPDAFLRTGATVEFGFIMAGRQTVMKGFILSASYAHGVADHAKLSMKCLCRFSDFE